MMRCPYCCMDLQDTGCQCYNPQCPSNLPVTTIYDTNTINDYKPNEINEMIDNILGMLEEYENFDLKNCNDQFVSSIDSIVIEIIKKMKGLKND